MSQRVSEKMRLAAALRADFRCEYCRLPDIAGGLSFHADHVISQKHAVKTILSNLAYCCPRCNGAKGSDLGTFLASEKRLTRFFHPRTDRWRDHFEMVEAVIVPKTRIGLATTSIFQLNRPDRIFERQLLLEKGLL